MQDGQQGDNNNQQGWVYKPGDNIAQTNQGVNESPQSVTPPTEVSANNTPADEAIVSWTASEYQANPKSAGWFGSLALASVLLAVIIYFITSDVIPTVVIGLMGIIIGIFAARQPHVLDYHLDNHGIYIGSKFYPYSSFKSFSVATDQAMGYISLMPLRRFMPPITVHYDPDDEDKIASTLADYLPFEEHKRDMVDSITRRFRL